MTDREKAAEGYLKKIAPINREDDSLILASFRSGWSAHEKKAEALVEALQEAHYLTCDETQVDKPCFICEALQTYKGGESDG